MDHREASCLLPEFVAEALDPVRRRDLGAHLAHCDECRDWVATFRLLEEELGGETATSSARHLSAYELSAFAVAPWALAGAARNRCARHTKICSRCRDELRLARTAVAEARAPAEPARIPAAAARRPLRAPRRLAWAAVFLLLTATPIVVHRFSRAPEEHQIRGKTIGGTETVAAQDLILVESTAVRAGASVTFRSGRMVVFGEGFSVDSDGSIQVLVEGDNGP